MLMRIHQKRVASLACCLLLAAGVSLTGALCGCSSTTTQDSTNQTKESSVDNTGKKVKVHYKGTLDDGSQFDSSYDRGEPLEFTVGAGQMIKGFDEAVKSMTLGEKKTVRLSPDEAYGERNDSLIYTYDKSQVPNYDTLNIGDSVYLTGSGGSPVQAVVTAKDGDTVTLDANNKMAGQYLTFLIELVEIED